MESENGVLTENAQTENVEVKLSPVQIQQEYFENLPDCDWVKYEKSNRNHLLQNIAFALFGGPSFEGDLLNNRDYREVQLEGYTSRQKEQVIKIHDKICEQSKYSQNDEDIFMSILLIVCAKPKPVKFYQLEPANYWLDLHQRNDIDVWCTAVFRVRKCIPTTVNAQNPNSTEENGFLVGIHPGEVLRIGTYLVRVSATGAEDISRLLEDLSQEVYANLMTICLNILSKLLPEEIARLKLLSPKEDLIVQIVKFVFNYLKHERPLGDPSRDNDNAKPCRVFIDDNARVYKDWDSYLKNNTLPKCVIIVPENGEYGGVIIEGEEIAVKLTVAPSPALGIKAKVLSSVDTASTVASLGAVGVLGAAVFTPIGPAVIVGATVATVATGVYGLFRSSLHLHDRRSHEQTISPTDAEARGSWINIAASSVGLAASAAAGLLSRSAAAGSNLTKTGQALTISVDLLRHANIFTGGVGVANSLLGMILKYRKHGETPNKLELFQFSAAILFFCHGVMSNRTAQNIIEDAQTNTINEYRTTLRSNRHRKIFDKISAESRRVQGTIQGNAEVIKGIKTIADKDQFFADVLRINKDVNQHKLRISMTSDGQVNLNAQHKFNPAELSSMGKEVRSELFSNLGPANVTTRNVSTKLTPTFSVAQNPNSTEENGFLVGIHPGEVLRIGTYLVRVSATGAEDISRLLEDLSQEVYANLMTICLNILSKLLPEDIARLKLLSPEEDLIVQIVKFVFNYLKHERPLGDPSRDNDNGIIIILKEFFQDGVIRSNTILHLKDRLMDWVNRQISDRDLQYPSKKQIICNICTGVRFG
ncbi:hypothetical protein RR48_12847 [Papilio machaon]|uniref:DUF4781 domain-containing protein n=1 Tax=Papilio machaon TaxID=76193 RepID=A0A194QRH2_PAPMA|nr:hypothetical protein RR48_12847 [Papilio machaon]